MKKNRLPLFIVLSLVLGIIVGLLSINNSDWTVLYLKPISSIFINLLKFIVCPVVLLSIIRGIISVSDIKKTGKFGIKLIILYIFTTAIATILALIIANMFMGFFPIIDTAIANYSSDKINVMDVFINIFPSNAIEPFVRSNMLQIIVIAFLVGFGILISREEGELAKKVIYSFDSVMQKIMKLIIYISPIGVFCMMANTVAVNGYKILGSLGIVIFVAYVVYFFHVIITYSIMLLLMSKRNPIEVYNGMLPAIIFAFTTTSSVATLPLTKECVDKLGVDQEYSSFSLPLGATINMDGAAIYISVITVFLAACYNVHLSIVDLITIVIMSTLASVGSAGVPGSAIVMLSMVLESVGIPIEGISIVLGCDKIFDMGRTALNVLGDAVCTLCLTSKKETK